MLSMFVMIMVIMTAAAFMVVMMFLIFHDDAHALHDDAHGDDLHIHAHDHADMSAFPGRLFPRLIL